MTDISAVSTDTAPILSTPILDIVCEWLLYVSAALIVGVALLMDSVHRPGMLGGSSYNIFGVLGAMWEAEGIHCGGHRVCCFRLCFRWRKR